MAAIAHGNLDMFLADRSWLASQPGMNPWDRGCLQLILEMEAWLFQDSKSLCDAPVSPRDACYLSYLRRLWVCWGHHWREAAGQREISGMSVAAMLRAGQSPVNGGKLGGDPLRDVVWVEAMLRGENQAIRQFHAEYQSKVERWAREVNLALASDLSWWQDMATKLIGVAPEAGKFESFVGQSALDPWLRTTVKRELIRQSKRLHRTTEVLQKLQDRAVERPVSPPVDAMISVECSELLSGVLRKVLQESSRNERLTMRLLFVEGLNHVEVGKVLQIHKGNVTRTAQRLMGRVQAEMGLGDSREAAVYERYRPCLEHVFESGDRGALRGLLERVLADLARMELPS